LRLVADELAGEILIHVLNPQALLDARPASVERDNRGRGRSSTPKQCVRDVVKVHNSYVTDAVRSRTFLEVDVDVVGGNGGSPEQSAWGDTGVEVVNLIARTGLEDIDSYKPEGALVGLAVGPAVNTLHEAHVGGQKR